MAAVLPYTDGNIDLAAAALRSGEVVAFATETVYGLGADTFNEAAIAKIYELKQRPGRNPLIAHVIDLSTARRISTGWTRRSMKLVSACWPGPLTLILPRDPAVPRIATGGLDTIAVRSPRHPLARALLYAVGGPISAPSANRSGGVSPTTAQHVASDYRQHTDLMVLDGGPCALGIESTVVDLCESKPVVRRLGIVTIEQLSALLGPIEVDMPTEQTASPGSAMRHYSPTVPAMLIAGAELAQVLATGAPAAVICFAASEIAEGQGHIRLEMPSDADGYAAHLYETLRRADASGCARIVIELPSERTGVWSAVIDRLRRATTQE